MPTYTSKLKRLLGLHRRGKGRLPAAENLPPIPGGRGIGERLEGSGTGGGMPDRLTEVEGARRHYIEEEVADTSGLLVVLRRPIKATQFSGGGSSVVVVYQPPDNDSTDPAEE